MARQWGLEHLATERTSPLGTLFVWVVSDVPAVVERGAGRAMHPLHREWAVTMIVAAAAHPDPRSKVALEALDARWELDAIKGLPSES